MPLPIISPAKRAKKRLYTALHDDGDEWRTRPGRYKPSREWRRDRDGYMAAHPPPLLADPEDAFLTPELRMHRSISDPLDSLSAKNAEAVKARDWAIRVYILIKLTKVARDDLFAATRQALTHPSEFTRTLQAAQEGYVSGLVSDLRGKLQEGRGYADDFGGREHVLAVVGSPFFHAVSMWGVGMRFVQGFEEDGRPRFEFALEDGRLKRCETFEARKTEQAERLKAKRERQSFQGRGKVPPRMAQFGRNVPDNADSDSSDESVF